MTQSTGQSTVKVKPIVTPRLVLALINPSNLVEPMKNVTLLWANFVSGFGELAFMTVVGIIVGLGLMLVLPFMLSATLLVPLYMIILANNDAYTSWRIMPFSDSDAWLAKHRSMSIRAAMIRYPLSGVFVVLLISVVYTYAGGGRHGDWALGALFLLCLIGYNHNIIMPALRGR